MGVLCSQCHLAISSAELAERTHTAGYWVCCSRCALAHREICIQCGRSVSGEDLIEVLYSAEGLICCALCKSRRARLFAMPAHDLGPGPRRAGPRDQRLFLFVAL